MIFKRLLLASTLSLLIGVFSLVFSGCRNQAATDESKDIELVFWTMQLADFKAVIQPMLDEFEAEHPNVRVKWVDVPGNEIEKRTLTAVLSPNVPDVVNLNPDFSATLATRNALINMRSALPKNVQETYLPVAWQAASLENNQSEITFGLPWYLTSRVTLYNRALLHKAGYAKPPSDFSTMQEFSARIKEKTGSYAFMPILTQSGNFLKELVKIQVPLYDVSGKPAFDTRQALAHLNFYISLYQGDLIPPESLSEDYRAAVDRYQSGTLALLLVGPNFLSIVKENAPAVYAKTDVAPQFPADSPFVDFSEMVLVVPQQSKHPKEALALAAFITNAKNQLALAKAAPVLPSVTSALNDPFFKGGHDALSNNEDIMVRARGISARQLLNAKAAYRIRPRQAEINELTNYYVQLVMLGRMDAKEGLKTLAQKIDVL
ncbi:MAG: sugar ABC transporter substrate-binding protein [Vampirovibrionales bacterium]|nr:sugar ABC transporter substrate-binding protein [Vampirovibrionales bacterium]